MTSPTYACVTDAGVEYHSIDQFVRGWSGYQRADAYIIAVCQKNRMVTIRATRNSPDIYFAGEVIVRMAASIERESLNDVVERFVWQNFEAEITDVDHDGCICGAKK